MTDHTHKMDKLDELIRTIRTITELAEEMLTEIDSPPDDDLVEFSFRGPRGGRFEVESFLNGSYRVRCGNTTLCYREKGLDNDD